MKHKARINYDWKLHKDGGYKSQFTESEEMATEQEAEQWLKSELDKTYPGQWKDNGGQYIHVKGGAGDPSLGYTCPVYNEEELHRQEIHASAQRKLEELKPRKLNEGHKLILKTLSAGKSLNDVPAIKDNRGGYVASAAECKDLEEWGYMFQSLGQMQPSRWQLTPKGLDEAKLLA